MHAGLDDEVDLLFKLQAVVCHRGEMISSGHYVVYLRNPEDNDEWWLFDDNDVGPVITQF